MLKIKKLVNKFTRSKPNRLALEAKDFTFGVEFEFGLRFVRPPFEHYIQVWELIRDTLIIETGLEIRTQHDNMMFDRPHGFMGAPEASTDNKIPESESFTTWVIGTDSSLYFHDEKKNDKYHKYYCNLEVQTPVLNFGSDALKEINTVLTALHKHYDVVVNESCGLHVHVGRGVKGFDLEPFQHLMATIWVFESQISELLHKSRHGQSVYCHPLRERSNLAIRGFDGNLLDLVLSTSHVNEVVEMFSAYENSLDIAYNISNLRQPFWSPVKRTLEFRQHEGCMDPEIVLHWASFVVELVAWAHKIDRQDLKIFLSKYLNQTEWYSVEDLFKEIGFPESTVQFWRGKVARLREVEAKEDEEREAKKEAGHKSDSDSSDTSLSSSF